MKNATQMYQIAAELLNEEFSVNRTWQQVKAKSITELHKDKENVNKKQKKTPVKKPTGAERTMELLRELTAAREEKRATRDKIRKQEARERENRFFDRMESLLQKYNRE